MEAQRIVNVTQKNLPLSCPMLGDEVYSEHPRVFLPIERTGEVTCPYCGTLYQLKED